MVGSVLDTMKNQRRRLKGNLKPNHFSLTFEDEYHDQTAIGNGVHFIAFVIA